jgi:hypothetical protein
LEVRGLKDKGTKPEEMRPEDENTNLERFRNPEDFWA